MPNLHNKDLLPDKRTTSGWYCNRITNLMLSPLDAFAQRIVYDFLRVYILCQTCTIRISYLTKEYPLDNKRITNPERFPSCICAENMMYEYSVQYSWNKLTANILYTYNCPSPAIIKIESKKRIWISRGMKGLWLSLLSRTLIRSAN